MTYKIVQKFGGSSVGSVERIQAVADRVAASAREGNRLAVVVSAMGDTTDELLDLLAQVNPNPPARETDALLSTGEMVSAALLASALERRGVPAVSLTGPQVGIATSDVHGKARILTIGPNRVFDAWDRGQVVVVAGFQGIGPNGDITTLGRGGSDTTAVALAAALESDVCEIFTDVDGIYTTDPRVVPAARKLDRIGYDEMLELASAGARVMQSRSIEFGKKYGVRIHVRSSFHEGNGTMIEVMEERGMEDPIIRGVAFATDQAKITVTDLPDHPGVAARLFGALAEKAIGVDVIVQSATETGKNDISFTLALADLSRAEEILRAEAKGLGSGKIVAAKEIGKVSIVGVGMVSHAGVAAKMFKVLSEEKINIQMISTSEIRVTVVIDKPSVEVAVRALHKAFGLG